MLLSLAAAGVIAAALVAAGSVAYRLHQGKPFLEPPRDGLLFFERGVSGRSDRSALARLVGARGLLWVAVSGAELHVSPRFPFNLMFAPEAFGWDHRVPGRTILEIRDAGAGRVSIRYRHRTGDEEWLVLEVAEVGTLRAALRAIGAAAPSAPGGAARGTGRN
ncbi:MAG: hypothetical protein IT514_04065 [Burkholderiales bacterium]|nr:hypothetical protein [Burkholderiales bacterium]